MVNRTFTAKSVQSFVLGTLIFGNDTECSVNVTMVRSFTNNFLWDCSLTTLEVRKMKKVKELRIK